jgi:hypothetical protein
VASGTLLTFTVIGLMVAAVYLLPLFELGSLSIRPNARLNYKEVVSFSLPWQNLVTAVIPFFFGASADYWGWWNLAEMAFYAGIPTLVLATVATVAARQRRVVLFFACAAVVSLLLALGGNTLLYRLLYQLPAFSSLRAPARFTHLLVFCLAMLAGFGIDALSRTRLERARRRTIACVATVAMLVGALLLVGAVAAHQWLLAQPPGVYNRLPDWIVSNDTDVTGVPDGQDSAEAAYHGLLSVTDPGSMYTFLPPALLVLAGVGLLLSKRLPAGPWLWILLLVADLGAYNARMPTIIRFPTSRVTARSQVADFITSQGGLYRAYWIRDDQPWAWSSMEPLLYDGLAELGGYTPLELERHSEFMEAFWSWEVPRSKTCWT